MNCTQLLENIINMNKIICVDGGNVMHRAIFSSMSNPDTVPSTYTYLRMIVGYLKRLEVTLDDKVIIAQDYGRSWRKGLDHNYKAQRKAVREERKPQEWWKEQYESFDKLYEKLEVAVNWHFVRVWGSEADDIASVIPRYYKDNECILISSDRDWEMLKIFDNVQIWSPITKKYKTIPAPMKVLMEKINGDVSDNLLTKPSSEAEFEKRKLIVDLTHLPDYIEKPIRLELDKIKPKNLYIHKIPFGSVQTEFRKLYKLNEKA
jgi:5'-3' exonuclease